MAVTPLYVSETHKPLTVTWKDDNGTAIDLTAATITVKFNNGATSTAGTGSVVVTSAANGQFTYTFSAADVATAGTYQLQFKASYGATDLLFSDPIPLTILALL